MYAAYWGAAVAAGVAVAFAALWGHAMHRLDDRDLLIRDLRMQIRAVKAARLREMDERGKGKRG